MSTTNNIFRKKISRALAAWLFCTAPLPAAILYVEDFDENLAGWVDRDPYSNMVVDWSAGRMEGTFSSQFMPAFQTDAFRIASGTNFVGNYNDLGIMRLSFDFYAEDILPSDLSIHLVSDVGVFSYYFVPLVASTTYSVDFIWDFGWDGVGESSFNSALASVTAIDIQITRQGEGLQHYYIDNITTYDEPVTDPGGGESVIPEPQTISIFLLAGGLWMRMRRKAKPSSPASTFPPQVFGILLALSLGGAGIVHAASPARQDFTNPAGWQGTSGNSSWNLNGGEARIRFQSTEVRDAQGQVLYATPIPDFGILRLVTHTNSAAFTGNYEVADISAIGFSFLATGELPSRKMVILEWGNTNILFQRIFYVEQTGVWYNVSASLDSPDGWIPVVDKTGDFYTARQSVSHIAIRFTRTGVTLHDHFIDNIFIARKPSGAAIASSGNNLFNVQTDDLLPGLTYIMETAPDINGPWTVEQTVSATGTTHTLSVSNDAPRLFWRFRLP